MDSGGVFKFEKTFIFVLITVCWTTALSNRTQFSLLLWSLISHYITEMSIHHVFISLSYLYWISHSHFSSILSRYVAIYLSTVLGGSTSSVLILKLAYLLELLGAFLVCGEFNIYLHRLWDSTFGLTLAVLSPAWSHMHRRLLRQPQSWQSCSLASHFTRLQASEDQILLVSWLRPLINLRLSRHCALDVYVSVGITPLTFIQTGVTLVESAHNTIPCLEWELCFSSCCDWH